MRLGGAERPGCSAVLGLLKVMMRPLAAPGVILRLGSSRLCNPLRGGLLSNCYDTLGDAQTLGPPIKVAIASFCAYVLAIEFCLNKAAHHYELHQQACQIYPPNLVHRRAPVRLGWNAFRRVSDGSVAIGNARSVRPTWQGKTTGPERAGSVHPTASGRYGD